MGFSSQIVNFDVDVTGMDFATRRAKLYVLQQVSDKMWSICTLSTVRSIHFVVVIFSI